MDDGLMVATTQEHDYTENMEGEKTFMDIPKAKEGADVSQRIKQFICYGSRAARTAANRSDVPSSSYVQSSPDGIFRSSDPIPSEEDPE